MTVATETLTIHLPALAVDRLRRIAKIVQRPIEQLIADTLQSTLPPLLDELPAAFHTELRPLENWSNEALQKQVFARLDSSNMDRYDDLLEQNATGTLSATENEEINLFRKQADLLMYRKAYAALLLKWRGQRVPTLAELEAAE